MLEKERIFFTVRIINHFLCIIMITNMELPSLEAFNNILQVLYLGFQAI